ncbi:unnamed protein product [Mesocestoides corti]|uniref:PX domain-containing protein n=2 Tax=Mesocestoides corti TaxID=53468 RepID=A0A0R3UR90_MESCO|nr:unnamed protein product [Mesocestoides corti]
MADSGFVVGGLRTIMSEEDGQDRTTWISPVTVSDDSKTTKRVPSRPGRGEVFARIIGVRKAVTNYETYIGYEIETVANRDDYPSDVCVVERRYREFDWLHKRFQRAYAVLFVPVS